MLAEFHALGFPMLALSAEHGHNIRALEEEMVDLLPVEDPDAEAKPENVLRLAMLGRPNAGKSSLVNAMIGEDRMIVSDVAGTTRDSVDIPFVSDGRACEFVDTAACAAVRALRIPWSVFPSTPRSRPRPRRT